MSTLGFELSPLKKLLFLGFKSNNQIVGRSWLIPYRVFLSNAYCHRPVIRLTDEKHLRGFLTLEIKSRLKAKQLYGAVNQGKFRRNNSPKDIFCR